MDNGKRKSFKLLRYFCLIFIILFGALTIISSGGGGGGDDDDDNDGGDNNNGGSNILESQIYNYGINLYDENPLTFIVSVDESDPVTISITGMNMQGTYNTSTQAFTMYGNIWCDTGEDGGIQIGVAEATPVKWTGTAYPTEGTFSISKTAATLITVSINSSGGGVNITYGEDAPVFYTWQDFLNISSESPVYRANAGYGIWEFTMKRVWYFYQTFNSILENQDDLETAGSNNIGLTENCDQFPPTTGTSGTRQYKYIDTNPNGEVNPDDSFQVTFNTSSNGCWYNDLSNDTDVLVKGIIDMNILTGLEDVTGFESVIFTDFIETETTETYEATEDLITTNGGFSIFISVE